MPAEPQRITGAGRPSEDPLAEEGGGQFDGEAGRVVADVEDRVDLDEIEGIGALSLGVAKEL